MMCAFFLPELRPVLHQCHLLVSTMVHFITQLQYYITFEVREGDDVGWGGRVRVGGSRGKSRQGGGESLFFIIAGDGVLLGSVGEEG